MKLIAYPSVPPKSSFIHLGYISAQVFKVKGSDSVIGLSLLMTGLLTLGVSIATGRNVMLKGVNKNRIGHILGLRFAQLILISISLFIFINAYHVRRNVLDPISYYVILVLGLILCVLFIATLDNPIIRVIRANKRVRFSLLFAGLLSLIFLFSFIATGVIKGGWEYANPSSYTMSVARGYLYPLVNYDSVEKERVNVIPSVDDIVARCGSAPLDAWKNPMPLKRIGYVGEDKRGFAFLFESCGKDGIPNNDDDFIVIATIDETMTEPSSSNIFMKNEKIPEHFIFDDKP